MVGKRVENLDVVFVRLEGATYDCHGIKYCPSPHLVHIDPRSSLQRFGAVAERNAEIIVGITSLGYDTPGYGYGERTTEKSGALQIGLAELSKKYDVPYIVDNAFGTPFIGTDIRDVNCDVMVYSMDKSAGGPTCGLIIGKEEPMVQIRRALGIHGARYGMLSSHGKAAYVTLDPGKEAMLGTLAAMEILKDRPETALEALEALHSIVLDEFETLRDPLKEGIIINQSPNSLAVEINYGDSWTQEVWGIPIFTIEDMYAGTCLIQTCMSQMGVIPTIGYDANIFISNGLGNTDEYGRLMEKPTRLAVQCVFRILEILSKYAGLID
jgi:hypothetical protein